MKMFQSPRKSFAFRLIASFVNVCFICSYMSPVRSYAQTPADLGMPAAGQMISLSSAYVPVIARGLRVHPENPILFDFLLDTGNSGLALTDPKLKAESEKLIKYFLASLTIPDEDQWVNLSPYEKNRIINDQLGQTEMGRDMLAEDYILKQLTSSLIYPEKQLGKEFWNRVYTKAQQLYGTNEIPVNTFNKVWITADKADIYVHDNTAFVVASHLKVMLEEDYMSLAKHEGVGAIHESPVQGNNIHSVGSQIVREIVLPELEKEVNMGKNFYNLRQIFHSMVLAAWYKKNLKQAILNQVYSNKAKINGVNLADPTIKEQIYKEYLKAYKKGVFNYIKEDIVNGQTVPHKYFSGGLAKMAMETEVSAAMARQELPLNMPNRVVDVQAGVVESKAGTPSSAMAEIVHSDIKAIARTVGSLIESSKQLKGNAQSLGSMDADLRERMLTGIKKGAETELAYVKKVLEKHRNLPSAQALLAFFENVTVENANEIDFSNQINPLLGNLGKEIAGSEQGSTPAATGAPTAAMITLNAGKIGSANSINLTYNARNYDLSIERTETLGVGVVLKEIKAQKKEQETQEVRIFRFPIHSKNQKVMYSPGIIILSYQDENAATDVTSFMVFVFDNNDRIYQLDRELFLEMINRSSISSKPDDSDVALKILERILLESRRGILTVASNLTTGVTDLFMPKISDHPIRMSAFRAKIDATEFNPADAYPFSAAMATAPATTAPTAAMKGDDKKPQIITTAQFNINASTFKGEKVSMDAVDGSVPGTISLRVSIKGTSGGVTDGKITGKRISIFNGVITLEGTDGSYAYYVFKLRYGKTAIASVVPDGVLEPAEQTILQGSLQTNAELAPIVTVVTKLQAWAEKNAAMADAEIESLAAEWITEHVTPEAIRTVAQNLRARESDFLKGVTLPGFVPMYFSESINTNFRKEIEKQDFEAIAAILDKIATIVEKGTPAMTAAGIRKHIADLQAQLDQRREAVLRKPARIPHSEIQMYADLRSSILMIEGLIRAYEASLLEKNKEGDGIEIPIKSNTEASGKVYADVTTKDQDLIVVIYGQGGIYGTYKASVATHLQPANMNVLRDEFIRGFLMNKGSSYESLVDFEHVLIKVGTRAFPNLTNFQEVPKTATAAMKVLAPEDWDGKNITTADFEAWRGAIPGTIVTELAQPDISKRKPGFLYIPSVLRKPDLSKLIGKSAIFWDIGGSTFRAGRGRVVQGEENPEVVLEGEVLEERLDRKQDFLEHTSGTEKIDYFVEIFVKWVIENEIQEDSIGIAFSFHHNQGIVLKEANGTKGWNWSGMIGKSLYDVINAKLEAREKELQADPHAKIHKLPRVKVVGNDAEDTAALARDGGDIGGTGSNDMFWDQNGRGFIFESGHQVVEQFHQPLDRINGVPELDGVTIPDGKTEPIPFGEIEPIMASKHMARLAWVRIQNAIKHEQLFKDSPLALAYFSSDFNYDKSLRTSNVIKIASAEDLSDIRDTLNSSFKTDINVSDMQVLQRICRQLVSRSIYLKAGQLWGHAQRIYQGQPLDIVVDGFLWSFPEYLQGVQQLLDTWQLGLMKLRYVEGATQKGTVALALANEGPAAAAMKIDDPVLSGKSPFGYVATVLLLVLAGAGVMVKQLIHQDEGILGQISQTTGVPYTFKQVTQEMQGDWKQSKIFSPLDALLTNGERKQIEGLDEEIVRLREKLADIDEKNDSLRYSRVRDQYYEAARRLLEAIAAAVKNHKDELGEEKAALLEKAAGLGYRNFQPATASTPPSSAMNVALVAGKLKDVLGITPDSIKAHAERIRAALQQGRVAVEPWGEELNRKFMDAFIGTEFDYFRPRGHSLEEKRPDFLDQVADQLTTLRGGSSAMAAEPNKKSPPPRQANGANGARYALQPRSQPGDKPAPPSQANGANGARYALRKSSNSAAMNGNGGIDLNASNMAMNVNGEKITIKFDAAMMAQFQRGDFSGVRPFIINITPVASVLPILGFKEEDFSSEKVKNA